MTWSMKGFILREVLGTEKMEVRRDWMRRRCGLLVKEDEKERMGLEPRRQLPGKWSSDIVCTAPKEGGYVSLDWCCEGKMGATIRFWRCIFTVGPLGALLIQM